jgi:hypothetical protein
LTFGQNSSGGQTIVAGTFLIAGTSSLTLNGGTLKNTTIATAPGASAAINGGTLSNCGFAPNQNFVLSDLKIKGDLNLQSSDLDFNDTITTYGPCSIGGTGTIGVNGALVQDSLAGGTLTFGSGITVLPTGLIGIETSPLVNNGTILSSGVLLNCGSLTNNGTILASGGEVALGCPLTTAQIGFVRAINGGDLDFAQLDNTAATLDLSQIGTISVGGRITGGTIASNLRYGDVTATDDDALEALRRLTRKEGIIPALESAHAVAHAARIAPSMPKDKTLLVNHSGRGDKDMQTVAKLLGVTV